jgi:hypothetical protein
MTYTPWTSSPWETAFLITNVIVFLVVAPCIGILAQFQLCADVQVGYYLKEDPSISCGDPTYIWVAAVARAAAYFYLCMIVLLAIALYAGFQRIQVRCLLGIAGGAAGLTFLTRMQTAFSFMWEGYRGCVNMEERKNPNTISKIVFENAVRGQLKLARALKREENLSRFLPGGKALQIEELRSESASFAQAEKLAKVFKIKLHDSDAMKMAGPGYAWETWALLRRSVSSLLR